MALALLMASTAAAAELKPATLGAFDRYVREAERRIEGRQGLWSDESPDRARRVRSGEIVVEPFQGRPIIAIGDALIHDWVGAVFLPGVPIDRVLSFVQDYDRHKEYYRPEVVESRILSRDGNQFHVFLRLVKKKVVTIVLDTEHDVRYYRIDERRWRSESRTTRVSEVSDAGSPKERKLQPGTGDGFLWALNSYWRFEERDGGTWVECEAISLTRDIPTGLGWLVSPFLKGLPRDSLINTLKATRDPLVSAAKK